jgi:hypothetical protein
MIGIGVDKSDFSPYTSELPGVECMQQSIRPVELAQQIHGYRLNDVYT